MEIKKERYAFVDVQNTDNTTKQLLGFQIDWEKLCEFLKTEWQCEKVLMVDFRNINNLRFKIEKR